MFRSSIALRSYLTWLATPSPPHLYTECAQSTLTCYYIPRKEYIYQYFPNVPKLRLLLDLICPGSPHHPPHTCTQCAQSTLTCYYIPKKEYIYQYFPNVPKLRLLLNLICPGSPHHPPTLVHSVHNEL